MQVTYSTQATPGGANEDYVVSGPDWWAVLDGATSPSGVETGCRHDVAWLVSHLASALAARLSLARPMTLTDLLADSIKATSEAHADTCDLSNPDSPSSTCAIIRTRLGFIECLALADSPIVIQHRDGRISVVADDRVSRLPGGPPYSLELVRTCRNNPNGGFWVASTKPQAARESVTRSFEFSEVESVSMFSDGVSRLVDRYGYTWPRVLTILRAEGPAALIRVVRDAERTRPPGRGKQHDDATALHIIGPFA